jgi:DNA-binding MarR family transcriptional regulator
MGMINLADFLCFRIGALSRKIYRHYNTMYDRYGITVGQSFILLDLLIHESSSVKDIAHRVQLDSPAITGFVDRLMKEDLVERSVDPSDRRSLRIRLTTKGRSLAEDIAPLADTFNEQMKQALSPEDFKAFERVLDFMEKSLD